MGEHWKEFDENLSAEPRFEGPENRDFRLRADSPCIDAGRPLTRTTQEGRGRRVPVYDARYFYDGFGIEGEVGDVVAVGSGDQVARIERVEVNYYQPGILVLDRDLEWDAEAPVSLPWTGHGPDIGAHETSPSAFCRPVALAEPTVPKPGEMVSFRLETPRADVEQIQWDFRDGETAHGESVSHTFRGPYPDTGTYTLLDDDAWHEMTVDVRTVRECLQDVRYLRLFRFYTHRNAEEGQEFWFDEFEVLPD
ncbi:MAG: PKD domain-containing protein [Candidatus Latescibacteria bacterium]|jgi:hypothetical protein|nr:PKD domain-containing protein [Candidatus Latescibacterota bacterium]